MQPLRRRHACGCCSCPTMCACTLMCVKHCHVLQLNDSTSTESACALTVGLQRLVPVERERLAQRRNHWHLHR